MFTTNAEGICKTWVLLVYHEKSVVVYDKKMDGIKDPDYQILLIFSLTH